jgi:single-strand DNA-binding protein
MRTTNLLFLRGYTGGAPKAFGNGRIAKVSVATNRSWIDKTTGERVEKTDWVTVTILDEQDAKFALANVRKGSPVYAECAWGNRHTRRTEGPFTRSISLRRSLTCWRHRRLRPRSVSRNSIHASGVECDRLEKPGAPRSRSRSTCPSIQASRRLTTSGRACSTSAVLLLDVERSATSTSFCNKHGQAGAWRAADRGGGGRRLAVRGLGVKGLPEPRFAG